MPERTPYQKGIIKRFYEHRDTLALQKLGETVSNLYLETSEKKIDRGWKNIESQLTAAGVPPKVVADVVADRDLGAVARLIAENS